MEDKKSDLQKFSMSSPEEVDEIMGDALDSEVYVKLGSVCGCLLSLFKKLDEDGDVFKGADENLSVNLFVSIVVTLMKNFGEEAGKA